MQGLNWQTVHLAFAAGLNQKADARALQPPELQVALDVQFEEAGGLQTRKPFAAPASTIFGGGSLSNCRRLERNGDELVLFTKNAIYSWLASQSKWALRGTHLAVAVEEQPMFTATGDQRACDRAELDGVILVAWVDDAGLWVAAQDATTRATLMAPTLANAVGTRPRFVVCSTAVLLFWIDTAANDLEVIAIDPTAPASAIAGAATTVIAATNLYYDVVKVPGSDTAIGGVRHTVTTSHKLFKVTQALAVTTSTKARTCDGPIAVSCDPSGATLQVVRANSTNIQGDSITVSSLADAATGQAVGTADALPVNQIAAAHRSVVNSGAYRCYAFWSAAEAPDQTVFRVKANYVDTAGSIGTQFRVAERLGVVSRAFDYDGHVYAWLAFAGESIAAGMVQPLGVRAQLQNTYFLYGDDGTLVSKCLWQRAGGFAASTGHLPQVQSVSGSTGFAWCGTERRIIPLGAEAHTGYADRGPVDVAFLFDDDRARRCARLGATLYVTGGIVMQYDGEGPTELGFSVYPWSFAAAQAGAGAIPDGKYSLKGTLRWQNAKGESERSTTATGGQLTISAGPAKIDVSLVYFHVTLKQGARRPVSLELWRTKVNPTNDSPFFLITGTDPNVTSGDNPYINNNPLFGVVSVIDNLTDSDLGNREANPENGAVLENLAPPPARVIAATESRIFLAGVAGDEDRVWYSKLRGPNQLASFHELLAFDVPIAGGRIVAISFMNGICVVFRETATYMFPGDGFGNAQEGANYGPVQILSADIGCREADSVAVTPTGICFQSSKGKYLLTRGWTMQYIGAAVADYDGETVVAAHVVETQHQVRWLTASRLLVFDYLAGQWAEWTIAGGVHATIWGGTYHYLTSVGALAQQTDFMGVAYGMRVVSAWIKPADLQGAVRLRWIEVLGELRTADITLEFELSYDYDPTVVDTKLWSPSPQVEGGPLQVKLLPSRPDCEAVRVGVHVLGAATQAILEIAGPTPPRIDDLSHDVYLDGSFWNATLTAVPAGDLGNQVTFSIGFVLGTAASVEVRDGQFFDVATGLWTDMANNCGVSVVGNTTTAQVAIVGIETTINAWSQLVQVTTPDPFPAATVQFGAADMLTVTRDGAFHDGGFALPSGEGIKLTGLSLELGFKRGLHRRLPESQKA